MILDGIKDKVSFKKYCVYQGQGVCEILENSKAEKYKDFIYLQNCNTQMKLLIPINNDSFSRFRPIISKETALDLIESQKAKVKSVKKFANWNRKYRYYMDRIIRNEPQEVCEIIQELQYEESTRELNFSEKKLLSQCKDLLKTEIELSLRLS